MRVYRVENAQGVGPFQSLSSETGFTAGTLGRSLGWAKVETHENDPLGIVLGEPETYEAIMPDDTHPYHTHDIWEPIPYEDTHEWLVGCANLNLIFHWFPTSSFELLREYGFKVSVYECHYVHEGTYQLLFCKDEAVLITRIAF